MAKTHTTAFLQRESNPIVRDIADAGNSTERLSQQSPTVTNSISNIKRQQSFGLPTASSAQGNFLINLESANVKSISLQKRR